jgi:hypothetical protein
MINLYNKTLSLVYPSYRTVNLWAETYKLILDSKPISAKTIVNRKGSLAHIIRNINKELYGKKYFYLWAVELNL